MANPGAPFIHHQSATHGFQQRAGTVSYTHLDVYKRQEFNPAERRNFERYVRNGGFVLVDDCNHDIDGLFAKSFEAQMASIFGKAALAKLPNKHPLYSSFFKFPDGPPATGFELNGWGDDLVHDYLRGIQINGRLGLLYSNKDYGCEWDYDCLLYTSRCV